MQSLCESRSALRGSYGSEIVTIGILFGRPFQEGANSSRGMTVDVDVLAESVAEPCDRPGSVDGLESGVRLGEQSAPLEDACVGSDELRLLFLAFDLGCQVRIEALCRDSLRGIGFS